MSILYDIAVDNGKYRFVYFDDARCPEAYRHGERWDAYEASMIGNKALISLVGRIDELQSGCNLLPIGDRAKQADILMTMAGELAMRGDRDGWRILYLASKDLDVLK